MQLLPVFIIFVCLALEAASLFKNVAVVSSKRRSCRLYAESPVPTPKSLPNNAFAAQAFQTAVFATGGLIATTVRYPILTLTHLCTRSSRHALTLTHIHELMHSIDFSAQFFGSLKAANSAFRAA
jgi:hypothetical protein